MQNLKKINRFILEIENRVEFHITFHRNHPLQIENEKGKNNCDTQNIKG